ncbi:MAG: rRNA maturation RNase YbeY [Candidatus Latescibacteria bacterium]|nr:rRNA maturation RNase YbeY [Candidatus Latescibacterota bacterium]
MAILCSPGTPELPAAQHRRLARVGRAAITAHPLSGPVQLVLIGDRQMRRLNASYRGKDRTTDVLSFNLEPGPESLASGTVPVWGEIYISLPRARAQAKEQAVPLLTELARLMVHGLLHLAGHDHDTAAGLRYMEGETERLLEDHGLLPPATP